MNVELLREDTPGCREVNHLNNAGSALMPRPVIDALREHVELETRVGGYEAEELANDAIAASYSAVAELVGTRPTNIAFTENATASYMQALSSIPFERGDVILTTANDYISNQIQFLSLQRRLGVRVERAPELEEGGFDPGALARRVDELRPRLVCVTQVPTNSGLVQDVEAAGHVCRATDTLYLVDACQSIGQMPVSVDAIGCDFLSATSRKFLRGPRGSGFLYVSDRVLERGLEPLFIDMRGAHWIERDVYRRVDDARRFENWEFAWSLVLATGAAARYATALGLEAIRNRARELATRLRAGLAGIDGARVLEAGIELSATVAVSFAGRDAGSLVEALRARRINTTAQFREYAVLDFDRKGVRDAVRLSPHYYNTEEELDAAVEALRELVGAP